MRGQVQLSCGGGLKFLADVAVCLGVAADRNFSPGLATVTVLLVDGQKHTGQVARFSPATADLGLVVATGKMSIAAERIAYVGFHRPPGGPPPPPNKRKGELKVHLSSELVLSVSGCA